MDQLCKAIVCQSPNVPKHPGSSNLHPVQLLGQSLKNGTSQEVPEAVLEALQQYLKKNKKVCNFHAESGSIPSSVFHGKQQAAWLDAGQVVSMLQVPRQVQENSDVKGLSAAVALTIALASSTAVSGGNLPEHVLSLVSSFRSHMEEVQPLGKGGFGSVSLVRNRLDNRLTAVKKIPFKSFLPPWEQPQAMELRHEKLLREVRALASLEFSPHVVRYHTCWIEPHWEKLGLALEEHQIKVLHNNDSVASAQGSFRSGQSRTASNSKRPDSRRGLITASELLHGQLLGSEGTYRGPRRLQSPRQLPWRAESTCTTSMDDDSVSGDTTTSASSISIEEDDSEGTSSTRTPDHSDQDGDENTYSSVEKSVVSKNSAFTFGSEGLEEDDHKLGSHHLFDIQSGISPGFIDVHDAVNVIGAVERPSMHGGGSSINLHLTNGLHMYPRTAAPVPSCSLRILGDDESDHCSLTDDSWNAESDGFDLETSKDLDMGFISRTHSSASFKPTESQRFSAAQGSAKDLICRSASESVMSDHEEGAIVLACLPRACQQQLNAKLRRSGEVGGAKKPGVGHLVSELAVRSRSKIKWPYILYISMEAVHGVTLDVWLKRRVVVQSSLLPQPGTVTGSSSSSSSNNKGTLSSSSNVASLLSEGGVQAADASRIVLTGRLGGIEREIFRQLVTGLLHCHGAGVIHRDLKPSNIFILSTSSSEHCNRSICDQPGAASEWNVHEQASRSSSCLVKIGDFGLAAASEVGGSDSNRQAAGSGSLLRERDSVEASSEEEAAVLKADTASEQEGAADGMTSPQLARFQSASRLRAAASCSFLGARSNSDSLPHTSGVGTASYSAPEQLGTDGRYGTAVDMFPLGLILMELCCPFATGMERAMAMRDARAGQLPLHMRNSFPDEAAVAQLLLSLDPLSRPTCWELLCMLDQIWGSNAHYSLPERGTWRYNQLTDLLSSPEAGHLGRVSGVHIEPYSSSRDDASSAEGSASDNMQVLPCTSERGHGSHAAVLSHHVVEAGMGRRRDMLPTPLQDIRTRFGSRDPPAVLVEVLSSSSSGLSSQLPASSTIASSVGKEGCLGLSTQKTTEHSTITGRTSHGESRCTENPLTEKQGEKVQLGNQAAVDSDSCDGTEAVHACTGVSCTLGPHDSAACNGAGAALPSEMSKLKMRVGYGCAASRFWYKGEEFEGEQLLSMLVARDAEIAALKQEVESLKRRAHQK
ncbi:hypothetical protein CEUSTIGMA_g9517.t1 [Chlamydomonas eustigma]|uniref:Protein kinase domain-containing protein n=1 Tax=Chlamydomonas eustigma TaxID=1157962 RepID=A0A250XGQ5_9CHLO|nr:hypothetical protein CEUSTIGMA_g9517.t1 [Chlamydomonas eustigma]|eukprot:GAX82089.1 hypothetical protein CEUSTIGMA_g9517.t1 [Chlamydomonas eustigma]